MPKQKLSGYNVPPPPAQWMSYTKWQESTSYDRAFVWYKGINADLTPVQATGFVGSNTDNISEVAPNGSMIAYTRNNSVIRTVDLTTLTDISVMNATEVLFGIRSKWSQASDKLAIVDGTQFPVTRNMLWTANPTFPPGATKIYDVASTGIDDFGWVYNDSKILFTANDTIRTINPDGTGSAVLIASGVGTDDGGLTRMAPSRTSNLVVYLTNSKTLRTMQIDGSNDTLIHTIGANRFRLANHWLSWDGDYVVYVYDTTNGGGTNLSDVIVVPTDGSGAINTGVQINTEYSPSNLSNNPVDVPHVFGDRFYFTESADKFPDTGTPNPDVFVSYALPNGTGRRVEDGGYIKVWGFSEA